MERARVSYSGGSTPPGPVTFGTGNITLRTPSTPADFWQTRLNTDTVARTANPPTGYTVSGSASIDAGASAVFVKVAGSSVFQRWS